MSDPIKTPDALVKEFKKSGEFDRLRRDLLAQFQNGDGAEAFWGRVDDIARARLGEAEDKQLHLKAADTLHRELLQELDRFPLIERAVADVPTLSDPEFAAGIRRHAEGLVRRSRGIIPVEEDADAEERRNSGCDGDGGGGGSIAARDERQNDDTEGPTRDEGINVEISDGVLIQRLD